MGLRCDDDSSSCSGLHGKERWQTLYELGLRKKEEMELIRRNYQEMKEQEEEECTFKPQIHSKNPYDNEVEGQKVSVVERTRMWAENRQKKIEMMKEQIVDKDIDECTFRPQVRKEGGDIRQSNLHLHNRSKRQQSVDTADHSHQHDGKSAALKSAQSVEKFVNRLQNVRNQKQELLEQEKKTIGSGNLWQNKVTVPKEPKLTTLRQSQ